MKIFTALLMFSVALTIPTDGQVPDQSDAVPRQKIIDVPAIQAEYGPLVYTLCDQGCWDVLYTPQDQLVIAGKLKPHRNKHWTCADKTRFLMTAEDGSKHCVRFPEPGEVHAD